MCVFAVAVVCEHQVPGFSAFECGLHQQVCRVYKPSASEWVCSIGSLVPRFPDSQTEKLVVFMDSADSSWDYSVSDQLSQLINLFTNTYAHTHVCRHTHTYMSAPWCVCGGVFSFLINCQISDKRNIKEGAWLQGFSAIVAKHLAVEIFI